MSSYAPIIYPRQKKDNAIFPIRDSYPSRTTPIVTWGIVAVNALVFLFEMSLGHSQLEELVSTYGFVPLRFVQDLGPGQVETIFTSMFLHGGWAHIIGNMWFLIIFGDNVEDSLGHFRYLVFYLLMGVAASLTAVAFNLEPTTPSIGASGAIAGVLGAYLVLYPRSQVLTFIPIFFVGRFIEISAWFYLLFWFFMQFLAQEEGVAWWAHVGGFLTGAVLVKLFAIDRGGINDDSDPDQYSYR